MTLTQLTDMIRFTFHAYGDQYKPMTAYAASDAFTSLDRAFDLGMIEYEDDDDEIGAPVDGYMLAYFDGEQRIVATDSVYVEVVEEADLYSGWGAARFDGALIDAQAPTHEYDDVKLVNGLYY